MENLTTLEKIGEVIRNHIINGNSKTDCVTHISYILFPDQDMGYADTEMEIAEYVYKTLLEGIDITNLKNYKKEVK